MADIFDPKKIIATLRAQGVSDKDIAKTLGMKMSDFAKVSSQIPNSAKVNAHRKANEWKYDNKHQRKVRIEDVDPDYEPIDELREKTTTKRKPAKKPRISRKKPKPKSKRNDWNAAAEERLKALFEAGYSTKEIADEFKTTVDAITSKINRMRKTGWKGQIGTTFNPLPNPTPIKNKPGGNGPNLSPTMRKALASILETNLGVAGRYLAKKWGLIDTTKDSKGTSGDITAAVIKANQTIISALTKLDLSLRRGTSSLTKAISLTTTKISNSVNETTELIRKQQVTERLEKGNSSATQIGSGMKKGGGGALGIIGALLGGAVLSSLFSDNTDASTNSSDLLDAAGINPEMPNIKPEPEQTTNELDYKAKEIKFEADDIKFEADDYNFNFKNGTGAGGPTSTPAQPKTPQQQQTPQAGGMFNNFFDKLRGGPGGSGFFNNWADKIFGTGGGDHKGGATIPSDKNLDKADKDWTSKSKPSATNATPNMEKMPSQGSKDVNTAIERAAKSYGLDPAMLKGIASIESSMNPTSNENNNRKYKGLFQLGPGEWQDNSSKGQNLYNPEDNAMAAARLLKSHIDWFKNHYHRDPTPGEIYMMHQQGRGFIEKGTMTNIGGNPYPGMQGPQTPDSFEAGWAKELDRRMNMFQKKQEASNDTVQSDVTATGDAPVTKPKTDMDRQFQIDQGNRDVSSFHGSWSDSIQPQDLATTGPTAADKLRDYGLKLKQQQDATPLAPTPNTAPAITPPDTEDYPAVNRDLKGNNLSPQKTSDAGTGQYPDRSDTIQTALLPTQGPDHFADFPMSDQGVGA